jgi:hypothetical protein
MPYAKKKKDDGTWQVINEETGDVKGDDMTEEKANDQLAALAINAAPEEENKIEKSEDIEIPFNMFIPMTKVNVEKREVWGWASLEEPDGASEIMDYASSKPFFQDWSNNAQKRSGGRSYGNVRAMHQPIAAGKLIDFRTDDKNRGVYAGARIVDDNEWKKVLEGVYTGYSVGGSYVRRWPDMSQPGLVRYTAKPNEISIVDAPCVKSATFDVIKGEGLPMAKMDFHPTDGQNTLTIEPDDEANTEPLAKAQPGSSVNLTINASPEVLQRFLRFLSLCKRAGNVGHSGTFGFELDGDGNEKIDFTGADLPDIQEAEIYQKDGVDLLRPAAKAEAIDALEKKAAFASAPSAPEPISSTNVATDGKPAIEIERMPDPSSPMEITPGKEPDQDTLMQHAVNKSDLLDMFDEFLGYMPKLIKEVMQEEMPAMITKAVTDAMPTLVKTAIPADIQPSAPVERTKKIHVVYKENA